MTAYGLAELEKQTCTNNGKFSAVYWTTVFPPDKGYFQCCLHFLHRSSENSCWQVKGCRF